MSESTVVPGNREGGPITLRADRARDELIAIGAWPAQISTTGVGSNFRQYVPDRDASGVLFLLLDGSCPRPRAGRPCRRGQKRRSSALNGTRLVVADLDVLAAADLRTNLIKLG
jgi:hypothetical protein